MFRSSHDADTVFRMAELLTEEPLDRYVNRPLAKPVTWALLPTPVSANQVTLFAALCGVAAGIAFSRPDYSWRLAGFLLVAGALVLDCVDGQLARARGGGSPLGYLLDGASDYVISFSLHVGLMVGIWLTPTVSFEWRLVAVISIFLSGLVMMLHSNAFEAIKFRYLATLGEDPGQHVKKQEEILATLAVQRGVLARIGHAGLTAYHRGQQKLNEQAAAGGSVSACRFLTATFLGPTLRLTVLGLAGFAAAWNPGAIAIYPVLYLALRRPPAASRSEK